MKKMFLLVLCLALIVSSVYMGGLPASGESAVIEIYGVELSSYDAYVQYMATHDIPEHFIPYEDMTAFGELNSCFLEGSDDETALYRTYSYRFDFEGQKLTLKISHYTPWLNYTEKKRELVTSDMRFYFSGRSSYVSHEGVLFYYDIDGKLSFVYWESHDVSFTLSGTPSLGDYHGNNVPLNMLLNENRISAFKRLCDDYVAQKTASLYEGVGAYTGPVDPEKDIVESSVNKISFASREALQYAFSDYPSIVQGQQNMHGEKHAMLVKLLTGRGAVRTPVLNLPEGWQYSLASQSTLGLTWIEYRSNGAYLDYTYVTPSYRGAFFDLTASEYIRSVDPTFPNVHNKQEFIEEAPYDIYEKKITLKDGTVTALVCYRRSGRVLYFVYEDLLIKTNIKESVLETLTFE